MSVSDCFLPEALIANRSFLVITGTERQRKQIRSKISCLCCNNRQQHHSNTEEQIDICGLWSYIISFLRSQQQV
jgi:hypothetical protein